MALLKIAKIGHPLLRQVARELNVAELLLPETQRFIDDLIETMRDANGLGLAAPQVFRSLSVVAIEGRGRNPRYPDAPTIPMTVLVNPRFTFLSEEQEWGYEGCLSIDDLRANVPRSTRATVEALDRAGQPVRIEAEGFFAVVLQHEIDHLFGTLFVDRADPRTFTHQREYERYVLAAPAPHEEGA
ncbi:MAG TPA: peptide deformylase [Stenomitos sp.]